MKLNNSVELETPFGVAGGKLLQAVGGTICIGIMIVAV